MWADEILVLPYKQSHCLCWYPIVMLKAQQFPHTELCAVSVNEHTKTRNGISLRCCTSFVKLLSQNWKMWLKLQINRIKGCSFTDMCSGTTAIEIFPLFYIIHTSQIGCQFAAFALCMCGHRHTCALTLNSPFHSCDYWSPLSGPGRQAELNER